MISPWEVTNFAKRGNYFCKLSYFLFLKLQLNCLPLQNKLLPFLKMAIKLPLFAK